MAKQRMNKAIKKRWVEALRSGKYEQGKGALNKDGKFCCLGVLCEQAVEAGVVDRTDLGEGAVFYGVDHHTAFLPPEVAYWAGLPDRYGTIPTKEDQTRDLSLLNDAKGYDFNQIANVIQRNL